MKKLIIFILLTQINFLYANVNIVTSIAPIKIFIKAIAKDKANITVMVKQGSSPHTYEPKPSQMIDIHKASLYFAIGVEFEDVWLEKFKNQNKNIKIIDLSVNIIKYSTSKHIGANTDPHIWTSPNNVKTIATNILNAMIKYDANNKNFYTKNYNVFIKSINNLDKQIKNILKNTKKESKFMVFHPSWGYFANQYNLIQTAIEIQGKSPKPKDLIKILKFAKNENIKIMITSPEFSNKMANQIAKTLNINVIKLSPLDHNWSNNLINLAKAIAK